MASSTFSLGLYLTGKTEILLKYYPSFEAFRFYHCESTTHLVLPHAKPFTSPLQIPTCYSLFSGVSSVYVDPPGHAV
jgi:hypothetical protein